VIYIGATCENSCHGLSLFITRVLVYYLVSH